MREHKVRWYAQKYLLRLLSWLNFFVIRHLGQESVSNFSRQTFPKSSGSSYQENINYKMFPYQVQNSFKPRVAAVHSSHVCAGVSAEWMGGFLWSVHLSKSLWNYLPAGSALLFCCYVVAVWAGRITYYWN